MQMLNFPSPYRQGESPYDIFSDRMSAITAIIQGIKGRIKNKYETGMINTTIDQISKALNKNQTTETINLLNADPGESIYPDIEPVATKFVDTFNMMGKLAQKESMMGNITPGDSMMGGLAQKESTMGGLPSMGGMAPTGGTPTSEVMLPKGDKAQILNYFQNMPEEEAQNIDWQPVFDYIKENRPKMMGSSSPMETWVMEQAMGDIESGKSSKEKFSESLKLAKEYSDYTEEPTEKAITSKYEMFLKHPEEFELMTRIEASYKGEERTAWEVKVDQLLDWREKNMISDAELKKGIGIDIAPEKKTQWQKEYDLLMRTDPSDNEIKKFVNAYITPKKLDEPDKLKDLTSTDINTYNKLFYGDEDDFGAITPDEYAEATDNWKRTNKNKPAPEHIDVLEKALQECLNTDNTIIGKDKEKKNTDEWFKIYEWIYSYYKDALKGKSPKYLPPEEIKKVGAIEGALTGGGVQKGDYGSALAGEGKPKDERGYIVGETYRDEEGVLWKYTSDGKFEEVEEEKKTQKRTR